MARKFDPESPHLNPYLCFAAVWTTITAKPHQVCKLASSILIFIAMMTGIGSPASVASTTVGIELI